MPVNLVPKRSTRVKTSLTLPKKMRDRALVVAREHEVSLSDYVEQLLRQDLNDRRLGLTEVELGSEVS